MSRERLASGHEDDFSRALLRSAEVDEPPAAAYAKVASALGVSVGAGLSASIAAPAAVAAVHTSVFAGRLPATLLGKVIAFGVSGALLSVAVLWKVDHDRGERLATRAGAPAARPAGLNANPTLANPTLANPTLANPTLANPTLGNPTLADGVQDAARLAPPPAELSGHHSGQRVAESPTPALPQKSSAELGVATKRAPNAGSSSSLSEQVASLDRARVALNSGDANGALHEIALYRSNWPRGVFLTEASVLEIEALAKRGDRAAAAARAAAFVEAHPDSPQTERLRALIPNQ